MGRKEEELRWGRERRAMVEDLESYEIRDRRILKAMGLVRRHRFIPEAYRIHGQAYGDHAGPIGQGQTISQPYIVAYMLEKLELKEGDSVLEIGAGSGYQAAVLAELGCRVFTVEIVPWLADHAGRVLREEGYGRAAQVKKGDGAEGWPEAAPFDAVIGACAAEALPAALPGQLKEGGRIILPLKADIEQRLVLFRKVGNRLDRVDDLSVVFVPMTHHSD